MGTRPGLGWQCQHRGLSWDVLAVSGAKLREPAPAQRAGQGQRNGGEEEGTEKDKNTDGNRTQRERGGRRGKEEGKGLSTPRERLAMARNQCHMAQPRLSSTEASEDSEEQGSRTWWQLWWPPVALGPVRLGAGCPHGNQGSPPWHDGSGAGTGQEGSDPVVFPCSHTLRPPAPVTTQPRLCGVLGASLAKQTHPRPLSISAMSPSPVPPSAIPPPRLLSHIHMFHSGSPKRGCPLHVTLSPAATPWGGHGTPRPEGMRGRSCWAVLVAANLDERAEEQRSPSCGQGHTGTAGTSPGLQRG